MIKCLFGYLISMLFALNAYTQNESFSRLFFPNTYGINYPLYNQSLKPNSIISNGFEYRFENKIPWFVRFTIDNYSFNYTIDNQNQTNAIKSRVKINGYYFGAGLRTDSRKWRFLALLQAGSSTYEYPLVNTLGNSFEVSYPKRNSISYRAELGIEYYFTDNFAVIVESIYILIPKSNSFWNNNFQNAGIKIGITTTLF